jgi:16S rRNA processing protein RimM
MPDTQPPATVIMAQIGRPQGLHGELRATSFTADPLALADYGDLTDATGRTHRITAIRPMGKGVAIKLAGITNRTAAEALNGVELLLPRAALPALDDEDDFYQADLIGLDAFDAETATDGARMLLGKVTAVHNFGAGDMLELRLVSGKTVFVPFTKAAVPDVSIRNGNVTIDPQAAGLTGDDEAAEHEADDGTAPEA